MNWPRRWCWESHFFSSCDSGRASAPRRYIASAMFWGKNSARRPSQNVRSFHGVSVEFMIMLILIAFFACTKCSGSSLYLRRIPTVSLRSPAMPSPAAKAPMVAATCSNSESVARRVTNASKMLLFGDNISTSRTTATASNAVRTSSAVTPARKPRTIKPVGGLCRRFTGASAGIASTSSASGLSAGAASVRAAGSSTAASNAASGRASVAAGATPLYLNTWASSSISSPSRSPLNVCSWSRSFSPSTESWPSSA
mmetsp:Transcript_6473/g.20796  ORF Transcript_6473/g.20796 Transcript_6473/m.20796 type:complete len:255 (-) Transcript_6473:161-925(-)